MKKSIVSAIALILLATALFGITAPAGASTTPAPATAMIVSGVAWFAPNSTQQAVPGMNNVPLFVAFTSTLSVTNLTVWVNLTAAGSGVFSYSYLIGPNKDVNSMYLLPALSQGGSTTVEQTVNISSTAPNGIYLENLSYTYNVLGSSTIYAGNTSFELPLLGSVSVVSPSSLFGTQSDPLIGTPGMTNVPVTVLLENTGISTATNVSVAYDPQGSLFGSAQHTVISALPSYTVIPVTFLVSISQGAPVTAAYSQNLTVSYYGSSHAINFNLPITGSSNLSIVNYYTNPPVIFQDEKFISLTIVTDNSGSSFARNVTASLSAGSFTVLTNPYNISYYPSGGSFNFTFLLNAMNVTGIAPLSFQLGQQTYKLDLNLHSYGSFAVKSDLPSFHTGTNKQLMSFNITNTGTSTLYDFTLHLLSPSIISLHIPSSNPLAALTESNVTFAQIDPGQTVTATFIVDTSSSASFGTYPAQLAISWRLNDSVGQFYKSYNFNEKITPTGIQSIQGNFTFTPLNIAVLILIVALIIGLIALAGRGRRLKKEAEELKRRKETPPFKQLPHKEGYNNDQISQVTKNASEENER